MSEEGTASSTKELTEEGAKVVTVAEGTNATAAGPAEPVAAAEPAAAEAPADDAGFFGAVIADEFYPKTLELIPDLSGKCYAITGCTSGTGFWSAVGAARKGAACIIMLNRKSSRAEAAEEKVKAEVTGDTKVVTVECDLQDYDNVVAGAKKAAEVAAEYGGLDALVNNAGVMGVPDTRTKNGYDVQMQTNHLSHFLLYKLLKPSLAAAAEARGEARVVQHSSGARSGARATTPADGNLGGQFMEACEPGTLGGDAIPECFNRYHQTKLANPVFMMALHEKLQAEGSKIKSICAEPGVAQTDLAMNLVKGHEATGNDKIKGAMSGMAKKYASLQSSADGACSLMMASFAPDVASGDFFMPGEQRDGCTVGMAVKCMTAGAATPTAEFIVTRFENEALTLNKANQELLWAKSEEATNKYCE